MRKEYRGSVEVDRLCEMIKTLMIMWRTIRIDQLTDEVVAIKAWNNKYESERNRDTSRVMWCEVCESKMHRLYYRSKGRFIPVGWICMECRTVKMDGEV